MGAIDALKGVGELVKQVHDAELKTELLQRLIAAQNECAALLEKNGELRDELTQVKDQLTAATKKADVRKNLTFADDVYYLSDDLGKRAICPACLESKGATIPIKTQCGDRYPNCPLCRMYFEGIYKPS